MELKIEYDASFHFPWLVDLQMKPEDKDTLKRERAASNQNRSGKSRSEIQELWS